MAITHVTTEIHGLRELDELFKKLGSEVATNVGWLAVAAGAKHMQTEMRKRAPLQMKGPHGGPPQRIKYKKGFVTRGKRKGQAITRKYYYGSLRQNIVVRRPRKIRNPNTVLLRISTGNAFWGKFLEYGTKKKDGSLKMRARPWFKPIMQSEFPRSQQLIAENLTKNFDKAARLYVQQQAARAQASMRRAQRRLNRLRGS